MIIQSICNHWYHLRKKQTCYRLISPGLLPLPPPTPISSNNIKQSTVDFFGSVDNELIKWHYMWPFIPQTSETKKRLFYMNIFLCWWIAIKEVQLYITKMEQLWHFAGSWNVFQLTRHINQIRKTCTLNQRCLLDLL